MDKDADLPLHDEAKARAKWRGDETILARDRQAEIDDAAPGSDTGAPDPSDTLLRDLAERPPD